MERMKNRSCRGKLIWSEEDIAYLKEMYPLTPSGDIADHLRISDQAVRNKARELGVKKASEWNARRYCGRYVKNYSGKSGFRL